MARKVSPFTELTHGEQQIRWLEYQSIRLPYNTAEPETKAESMPEHAQPASSENSGPAERTVQRRPTVATPPPEVFGRSGSATKENIQRQGAAALSPTPQTMRMEQKARHRQYDAVIEKMKQAERRVGGYQVWSK